MLDFKNFASSIEILNKHSGKELRKRYVDRFINKNHKLYYEQIERKHNFIDGACYIGYLWDYLLDKELVSEDYIESVLKNQNQLYVFWDIHSCERIHINNYWKFDKDAILKMNSDILLSGLEYLPEDIYIFDDTMKWTIAYTHEDINGMRYCLKGGMI